MTKYIDVWELPENQADDLYCPNCGRTCNEGECAPHLLSLGCPSCGSLMIDRIEKEEKDKESD